MTDATLTLNLTDRVAAPFDTRRAKVWIELDTAEVWDENGVLRVDAGKATVDDTGLATITGVPVYGATTNPTTWQTYVCYEIADVRLPGVRGVSRVRGRLGPFAVTADADVSDLAEQQVAAPTITASGYAAQAEASATDAADSATAAASSAAAASSSASQAAADRQYVHDVSNIDTPDALVAALVPPSSGSSTSAALTASIVGILADNPEVIAAVVTAVEEGGSGNLLIVVTGGTDTLPAEPNIGQLLGRTYTEETSIETTEETIVLPTGDYVWRWNGISWEYRILDGWQPTVETTLPTAGTLGLVAAETSVALTVTGAMDDTGLHALPYSFRISSDGGTTWSAYTAWQTSNTYDWTDLDPSTTYTFQHRVRDVYGNVKVGLAVAAQTAPLYTWAIDSSWDFTAADSTDLNGLAAATGTGTMTAPASNAGASPPIYVNVSSNKGHVRANGSYQSIKLTEATAKNGRGFEFDATLHATAALLLTVDTNGAATNRTGFAINAAGAISAFHSAAGSTVYTPAPGAPTVVPDTCHLRVEFSKNNDGSCTGRIYVDGTLYGSVLTSGWTWQGKIVMLDVASNQQDSYLDNLNVLAGTAT